MKDGFFSCPRSAADRVLGAKGLFLCLAGALLVGAPTAGGAAEGQELPVVSGESRAVTSSYVTQHATPMPSRPGLSFVKGLVIVQLGEGVEFSIESSGRLTTSVPELNALLDAASLRRADMLFPWDCAARKGRECSIVRLQFPEESNLEFLTDALSGARGVVSVDPVGVHEVHFYPNDEHFDLQWALSQDTDRDLNAPEAWDVERGDSSIIVGMIDTGVDWMHPDLAGFSPYTAGNIWTNWVELKGSVGVDDDGNGFIDDTRGWDFVDNVGGYAGEDTDTPDNNPADFFGHGTHTAGIVGALADNAAGVAGLANRCKLMPLRAGWCTYGGTGQPVGVVRMDFCAQAVMYAARNGARVINCSWANDASGGLPAAADTAVARGAIVVVSAGNGATTSQGANYLSTRGDCFTVASTNSVDERSTFSNYGSWIDFCAPGDTIASTYYERVSGEHIYAFYSGTSMAAPYASGLSALLLSNNPSLTRAQVKNIIRSTCVSIEAVNPMYVGLLGSGRIDAYAALALGTGDWQARLAGRIVSSPVPVSAGALSLIAFTGEEGCTHLLGPNGQEAAGWPKCGISSFTSPASGDVNGDGQTEVVVGSRSGDVYVWTVAGSPLLGFPVSVGDSVTSGPMLADFDGDGAYEIVCATADSILHVLKYVLSGPQHWGVSLSGAPTGDPGLSHLGADTTAFIVIGTSDSRLHALTPEGTSCPGWPADLGTSVPGSPVMVDMDADGLDEIFVGASDGRIFGIDDTGAPLSGWPRSTSGAIARSVALGDVDGDGFPEVVAANADGRVYAMRLSGQLLPGWSVATSGPVFSSPTVVDLSGEGRCEVAVGSDDRDIHVWSYNGTDYPGWPRSTGGAVRSSICLWDFDGDGLLEAAVGSSDKKLHYWQLAGSVAADSLMAWPMYRHDSYRSGNSGTTVESVAPAPRQSLAVNAYPNPFSGGVTFECLVTGSGAALRTGHRGRIRIFDVRGGSVAELSVDGDGESLIVPWAAESEAARKAGSGVYFYEAQVDGFVRTGKVVFLRR
ncbi:MAG: S8 family serine peptidase [Candidatus Eisenbacteria bacterium]